MTAEELRDKFEKDLKELQDACKHEESEWMEDYWAPGHYSGMVNVCNYCEKILEKGT